jgi:hypothetical protein
MVAAYGLARVIARQTCPKNRPSGGAAALAFTIAPHLQTINYRGCFSPFGGL